MTRYLPPAVRFPLASVRGVYIGLYTVWGLSAVLLLAWSVQMAPLFPWAVIAVGWLLWGLAAWGLRRAQGRSMAGLLAWDGAAWYWLAHAQAPAQAVHAPVVLWDVQTAMLLECRCTAKADRVREQHAWVCARSDPARWGDWRRAVYSKQTAAPDGPDGA